MSEYVRVFEYEIRYLVTQSHHSCLNTHKYPLAHTNHNESQLNPKQLGKQKVKSSIELREVY